MRKRRYFFFLFVPRDPAPAPLPRPLPRPVPFVPFRGCFEAIEAARVPSAHACSEKDGGNAPGDCLGSSSSSAYSVPASVPVATLSRGVGATLSSPLSWVNALLSLSPPTKPAMCLSLLFPFRPPRPDFVCVTGDGAGDEEGRDTDARIRRSDMMASNVSSWGRVYSCRKKGCIERLSDGDGERGGNGGVLAGPSPGKSYPSASCSASRARFKKRRAATREQGWRACGRAGRTHDILEDVEVVAGAQLRPEVVDGDELAGVAEDRVAHGEDVEVAVDADGAGAHERAEEGDLALDGVEPAGLESCFVVVDLHLGRHGGNGGGDGGCGEQEERVAVAVAATCDASARSLSARGPRRVERARPSPS